MIANMAARRDTVQPNAKKRRGHFITSLSRFATVTEKTIDATVIMILAF
jgi:hypothetical protein